MNERLSLIAALGADTCAIGKDNGLLWRIPADLARFKELTLGHPIIMGARTYESIGRPLPGRTNIVLCDTPGFHTDGCMVYRNLEDAIRYARSLHTGEVFVIGGGSVYAQTIGTADRLYLTLVESPRDGDTFFPAYRDLPFAETSREEAEHEGLRYAFVTLDRAA